MSALLLTTTTLGCKSQQNDEPPPSGSERSEAVDTLPDDFVEFFDHFHKDSAFQMEHIIFPLEGLPDAPPGTDSLPKERFFWQREDWVMHQPFKNPAGEFEHWYQVINPRIIEHWVNMKGTNMVIRRRFARLDDGWYLIYYSGMRPYQEQ